MKTFYIDPKEIKVHEELGRVRKDMGDLKDLADSIKALGQIVPVIVNDKNELIDGGRRVGACIMLNKEIFCVAREEVNLKEMKALELEANIKRKAFNPVEEMEGIKFLHEMKMSEHPDGMWDGADTGRLLGMDSTSVTRKVAMANAVEAFPELKKLKTEKEIKKAIKEISKVTKRAKAVKEFEEKEESPYDISVKDMGTACIELLDHSIDVLITDPPYGIDIDKNMEGMKKVGEYSYDDNLNGAISLYCELARESARFIKEDGHAFIFFAPELYAVVKQLFTEQGWQSNHRPIIWIKHSSGQTNQPTMWPSACYEMCMYFRRDTSKLVLEGKPDWIQFPPVSPDAKVHPSEKPVNLLRELLQRVALPGDVVFDPFMGSGSAMEAAILEQLIPIGSDKAKECYDMTMERVNGLK